MNFVFVDNLKQDGLALSSTLSYTSFFIFSFALVLYKVRLTDRSFFARELLWSLVNGTVSYLISLWVSFWIFENVSLISKIIMVIIFISIYTLNTVIAKHHSVTLLTNAMLTYKHYRKSQA